MNSSKIKGSPENWCLFVCLALGAIQAWFLRYAMISDGVSYLDIGDAYFRRDWKSAINGYWSPAYSWCLGLASYLLKPSIWWEFVVVHFVNFLIYVGALFSFRFFLHSVLRSVRDESSADPARSIPLPESSLVILCYSVFLWGALILIDLGRVTPDLLVAALMFLMAGYLVELRSNPSYAKFALAGSLAGFAYLSKTIMFPVGLGFLGILLFSGGISKRRVLGSLLAAGAFLAVSSPFILALSKQKGRLTYGDTGRLAYAQFVSPGAPQIHWQGEPSGSGTPVHPTRKVLDNPPVFEFGEPIQGTYPPWDDPSYFNEGMRTRLDLHAQLRALAFGILAYERYLIREPGLLAGVLVLLWIGGSATFKSIVFGNWDLLVLAGLSLGAYALVLVLNRYIAASLVVLFVAFFAAVRVRNERYGSISRYVAGVIALSLVLAVAVQIAENGYASVTVGADPPAKDQVRVALGLMDMGLPAGAKVAVIGYGLTNHWARLGRFRIVAEAFAGGPEVREFWASAPDARDRAYEALKSAGAQAIIAWQPPKSALDPRWKKISSTDYYVYRLQN